VLVLSGLALLVGLRRQRTETVTTAVGRHRRRTA
jgi:hypothetical protein